MGKQAIIEAVLGSKGNIRKSLCGTFTFKVDPRGKMILSQYLSQLLAILHLHDKHG